ncbi:hypothetical protein [Caldovatus aquaticus]|uniref:Phasin domain-containing protein n=1 Tax=Caldovatus aquaticus TaxID=2865671 RepID=A0ABS7F698_9PROT|nr:hypothetical protein [Caldovatus aquaticus]MBW8271142.1 hypothetical protein [Caldovatus aquaticus]
MAMERKVEISRAAGRTAEAPPSAANMWEMMAGCAEAARPMLWAVEGARAMLDFNRALLDLGRDVVRRQQDAAIEATLQAFRVSTDAGRAPAEAGFPDFAQLGLEAFDRMIEAMRAANDAAFRVAAGSDAEAGRKAAAS